MFRSKKNRIVSLEMNDFYIRILCVKDGDLATATHYEYPLPTGIVVDEIVIDELAFFDLLKGLAKNWNIAKHDLRFFVPDHSVMMRTFEHPKDLSVDELKGYVEMELGRTIHLPFENPLIDVYDPKADDGEAVIFAAPSEEVVKLMHLYEDVHLHPTVLDVQTLSNIRFLDSTTLFSPEKTYLIADWSINAVSISIYSNGNVDFLRYQPSENPSRNWRYSKDESGSNVFTYEGVIEEYHIPLTNHVYEIERILNFYHFSLHKGEKAVDQLIVMGENPEMDYIVAQMRSAVDIPIQIIDDAYVRKSYSQFGAQHTALIGLALKGGS
jgi:type IV pilus assembly protein PilM